MAELLTIALNAEGSTDYRFLKPIIHRTIEDIILQSDRDIELYPIQEIQKQFKKTYQDEIIAVSKCAFDEGIKCLIIHCDADNRSEDTVITCKIKPAIDAVNQIEDTSLLCRKIIPLIPITMTEAWMLADIDVLKSEIGAGDFDNKILGLTKKAETFSDPKQIIINIIAIAQQQHSKRHRKLDISELYLPLGQKIELAKLKKLNSYQQFYDNLKSICLPYC